MREMALRVAAYVVVFIVLTTLFEVIEWQDEPQNPPRTRAKRALEAVSPTQFGLGAAGAAVVA